MKEYDAQVSRSSQHQGKTRPSGAARTALVKQQPIAPITEEDEDTSSTIKVEAQLEEVRIDSDTRLH